MKSSHAWAAHLCNLSLLGGFFAFALLTFESVPPSFPMHYGLDGTPDRWVETTWGSWLILPAISALLTAFLYAIAIFISVWGPRHPRWINVPAKKIFLQLPPEEQAVIIRTSSWALPWVAVPLNLLLFYTQWIGLQVAFDRKAGLDLPYWLLALLAVPAFAIVPLLGIRKNVLEAARRHGIE